MKKFDVVKTLQLVVYIVLSALALTVIFGDAALYQLIGRDAHVRILCVLLWLTLLLSFGFILVEFSLFSQFKRQFRELDFVVHSDQVSGLANRYSCDAVIEKYLDRPLPKNIACVMLDLTNIREINQAYGHLQGNSVIREFSAILQASAGAHCFVGRNGGNKFMALFENYSEAAVAQFLSAVRQGVEQHNAAAGAYPIEFKYGAAKADKDPVDRITALISLSNKRIYEEE